MINCKLHRLLLNSNVFGSVRSDVCSVPRKNKSLKWTKSYKIQYKVKTDKKVIYGFPYCKTERSKVAFISRFISRQSKSVCLWQEPSWNVNYITQPPKNLKSRLEWFLSPRNFKRVNKDAKIYISWRWFRSVHEL